MSYVYGSIFMLWNTLCGNLCRTKDSHAQARPGNRPGVNQFGPMATICMRTGTPTRPCQIPATSSVRTTLHQRSQPGRSLPPETVLAAWETQPERALARQSPLSRPQTTEHLVKWQSLAREPVH